MLSQDKIENLQNFKFCPSVYLDICENGASEKVEKKQRKTFLNGKVGE